MVAWLDPKNIRFMLEECDTWAVVGLSGDPHRTAYDIARMLQRRGKRIVPVHPEAPVVLGEQGYATLADIPFPVDVVDVFRRPDAVPAIAADAVAMGAGALWLQFGVISTAGAELAHDGGLAVVMDRCLKVEHARHLGRMHWLGFNTWQITATRPQG